MDNRFSYTDKPFKDEIDLSNDPYQQHQSADLNVLGTNQDPNIQQPLYPGQQQPPQSPRFGQKRNDYIAKNYNDFLERQGIPTITPEDLAILRECGNESFFYRCLPITAALCGGLIYTARMKQMQPKFYHFLGTVFFGYFIGKISYRSKCEEKLINSKSNSPFVNAIRKRRGLFVEEYDSVHVPDQSMESDWTTTTDANRSYGMHEFDQESLPLSSRLRSGTNRNNPFHPIDPLDSGSGGGGADLGDIDHPVGGGGGGGGGGVTYDDLRNRNRSTFKNI